MTKREYLELLVKSCHDGTFPSIDGKVCLFRKNETPHCKERCAVGLLIPDDEYDRGVEARGVRALCEKGLVTCPEGMTSADLVDCQSVHDDRATRQLWDGAVAEACFRRLDCFRKLGEGVVA